MMAADARSQQEGMKLSPLLLFLHLRIADAAGLCGSAHTCGSLLGANGFISAPSFKNSCSVAAGERRIFLPEKS